MPAALSVLLFCGCRGCRWGVGVRAQGDHYLTPHRGLTEILLKHRRMS
ncbi:hypothetical protein QF037_001794 [Streptomyces canus]|nr:hypothetical protein [Streptomyces canus]MDQ0597449.1 hypothetical protein [Streptomyces canus]